MVVDSAETPLLQRGPWWLPLLIPGILTPIVVASQIHRGQHVIQWDAFSVIVGWFLIALWMGAPCFFAGLRFIRHAQSHSN